MFKLKTLFNIKNQLPCTCR